MSHEDARAQVIALYRGVDDERAVLKKRGKRLLHANGGQMDVGLLKQTRFLAERLGVIDVELLSSLFIGHGIFSPGVQVSAPLGRMVRRSRRDRPSSRCSRKAQGVRLARSAPADTSARRTSGTRARRSRSPNVDTRQAGSGGAGRARARLLARPADNRLAAYRARAAQLPQIHQPHPASREYQALALQ